MANFEIVQPDDSRTPIYVVAPLEEVPVGDVRVQQSPGIPLAFIVGQGVSPNLLIATLRVRATTEAAADVARGDVLDALETADSIVRVEGATEGAWRAIAGFSSFRAVPLSSRTAWEITVALVPLFRKWTITKITTPGDYANAQPSDLVDAPLLLPGSVQGSSGDFTDEFTTEFD